MKGDSSEFEGITNAILRRLVADQSSGTLQSLETYEEFWPDHREIVQEVFHEQTAGLEAPEEEVGRQFASHVLERELGRGGQGTVWLARDVRLDRLVALKVLTGLHGADARLLQRFHREARVASRLDHPGICTIYEFGHDGGVPFIAMRYLEGETLAEKLDAHAWGAGSAPLDLRGSAPGVTSPQRAEGSGDSTSTRDRLRTLLRCFERVGDALHEAHESGIVHRDIKPGNVMIDPQGHPVLLDFGLARDARDERGTLTMTGDVLGTSVYMAPEQVSPNQHGIDRRTDVFSLASTLYECLTGARPLSSPTREGLYREILSENPVAPSRRVPRLPRELDVVLATALEKEPDRRYQSARDFVEDLRRVRENEPILARRPGFAVRTLRWSQRNPALAALIVVLAAGVVTSLLLLSSERMARRELQAHAADWEAVWADLDRDPRFEGMAVAPQMGLIPIGKDPDSQLWEFAHLETGVPVTRSADGRLELTEDSGLVFVLVPGGTFLMGSQGMDPSKPNYDPTSQLNSYPVHDVTVPAFFVSKYEMTQSQWVHVAGENPSTLTPDYVGLGRLGPFFHPNNPVESVSWEAARRLISRLRLELPPESWWEYACRAGTRTPYWTGVELTSLKGAANLADEELLREAHRNMSRDDLEGFDDGYESHAPVGLFRPNAFGLHDMVGNVWEWCEDAYSAYPGASRLNQVRKNARVLRGSSCRARLRFASSAARFWGSPDHRDNAIGLRPIRRVLP